MPNTHKKNILYLVDALTTGGAQTALYNVIDNLDIEAYHPHVITLFGDGRVGDALRGKGVRVECLYMQKPFALRTFYRFYPYFVNLVKQYDIELVHSFLTASGIYGGIVARRLGVKSVLNVHSVLTRSKIAGRNKVKYLELLARSLNKHIIAGNQLTVRELMRLRIWRNTNCIHMIYNGVNPAGEGYAKTFSEDVIRLTMVANFFPEKDHITLIKAYEALKGRYPLRLTFIAEGDTEYGKRVMGYIEEKGLREIVFRKTRDADTYTHQTDIFVLTTHSEGDPIVLKEAMSVGVPVICTRVGAVDEVIDDGVDGLLVNEGDVEGVIKALALLIEDRPLMEKMRAKGGEKYKSKFAIEKMSLEYKKLYSLLLS